MQNVNSNTLCLQVHCSLLQNRQSKLSFFLRLWQQAQALVYCITTTLTEQETRSKCLWVSQRLASLGLFWQLSALMQIPPQKMHQDRSQLHSTAQLRLGQNPPQDSGQICSTDQLGASQNTPKNKNCSRTGANSDLMSSLDSATYFPRDCTRTIANSTLLLSSDSAKFFRLDRTRTQANSALLRSSDSVKCFLDILPGK